MKSNLTPVPQKAESRLLLRNEMWRTRCRAALAAATRRARSEMSTASIRARGSSLARATAMQPLPVPTSTQGFALARRELEDLLDQDLGLGPGHQHRGRDLERDGPELLGAGEVGQRHAVEPFPDQAPEAGLGGGGTGLFGSGQEPLLGQGGGPQEQDLGFENGLGAAVEERDALAVELEQGPVSFQSPSRSRSRPGPRRAPGPGPAGPGA